jgi:2-C-methyl-D-erythritol 4-phosphate cytidylyltransferase
MVGWSIAAFRACESVRSIVVACPPGNSHDFDEGEVCVVDGGTTRAESVSNALGAVSTELVAIHDAARPLVTPELIESVVATLDANPDAAGAIAATPVTNTIKQAKHRVIEATVDRERLWAAQTPQVFRVDALREALEADPERAVAATDEAMLLESAGGRVMIHSSPAENLKVTTPLDLRLADLLLAERDS